MRLSVERTVLTLVLCTSPVGYENMAKRHIRGLKSFKASRNRQPPPCICELVFESCFHRPR